jgi:hypothetical protein
MTQDKATDKLVDVTVNNVSVHLPKESMLGSEIKTAAIAQGVPIRPDFVLFEDLKNGQQRIVRDDESIKVKKGDRFEAIANDDNS